MILLARLAGFEPATYGLEVRCSIHLSYRRWKIGAIKLCEPIVAQTHPFRIPINTYINGEDSYPTALKKTRLKCMWTTADAGCMVVDPDGA